MPAGDATVRNFLDASGALIRNKLTVVGNTTIGNLVDASGLDVSNNAVISKTVTSHTNPTGGLTEIVLSPTDTDIDVGTYDYDMQYKTDTGDIVTFEKGNYKILADVTRRTS